jgi:hypothetical protein
MDERRPEMATLSLRASLGTAHSGYGERAKRPQGGESVERGISSRFRHFAAISKGFRALKVRLRPHPQLDISGRVREAETDR